MGGIETGFSFKLSHIGEVAWTQRDGYTEYPNEEAMLTIERSELVQCCPKACK